MRDECLKFRNFGGWLLLKQYSIVSISGCESVSLKKGDQHSFRSTLVASRTPSGICVGGVRILENGRLPFATEAGRQTIACHRVRIKADAILRGTRPKTPILKFTFVTLPPSGDTNPAAVREISIDLNCVIPGYLYKSSRR